MSSANNNPLHRQHPDSPRPSETDLHGHQQPFVNLDFAHLGDLPPTLEFNFNLNDFERFLSGPSTSSNRSGDESPDLPPWLAIHRHTDASIETDDFGDPDSSHDQDSDHDLDQDHDFGAEDYTPYMPRRQSPGYVDLTREATPPLSEERSTLSRLSNIPDLGESNMPKRSRATTTTAAASSRTTPESSSGPAYKRPRLNSTGTPQRRSSRGDNSSGSANTTGTANTNTQNTPSMSEVEHIDLADDNTSLAEALQKQRVEQVKAQAQPPADAPLRLSNITCVICMDSPTDITATACGHVFCHTCLMEALIAGENRQGLDGPKRSQCPVCRKTLNRNKASDVIPLLLKKPAETQPRRRRQS